MRAVDALSAELSRALPCVERAVVGRALETRSSQLELRLERLVRVLEREDEAFASETIRARVESGDEDASDEDERLVEEWMLSRYMVAELAKTHGLFILRLLTSPLFVGLWVLLPHFACAALHHTGQLSLRGLPYAVSATGGLVLLALYFATGRRRLTISAGRFLLPQTSAALFVGLMEVVSADESWSVAVLEYPWVRVFKMLAFLVLGFVFIREVLLSGQLQSRSERGTKNRRAASVMSLVMWQSAVGVVVFGVLFGRIMGARAAFDPAPLEVVPHLGAWLPSEVQLAGFSGGAGYRIFPWALLPWTIQVFFLSANFERILSNRS